MEQIWAPWRIDYIRMEKPQGCFLCDLPNEDDDECNLILYRGKWNFIMMNNTLTIRGICWWRLTGTSRTWINCRSASSMSTWN